MFKSLITLTSSNSELRKDFLDRKKVLKSLEANSLIYLGNVGGPARCRTEQHPNVRVGKAKNHVHHPKSEEILKIPWNFEIFAQKHVFSTLMPKKNMKT